MKPIDAAWTFLKMTDVRVSPEDLNTRGHTTGPQSTTMGLSQLQEIIDPDPAQNLDEFSPIKQSTWGNKPSLQMQTDQAFSPETLALGRDAGFSFGSSPTSEGGTNYNISPKIPFDGKTQWWRGGPKHPESRPLSEDERLRMSTPNDPEHPDFEAAQQIAQQMKEKNIQARPGMLQQLQDKKGEEAAAEERRWQQSQEEMRPRGRPGTEGPIRRANEPFNPYSKEPKQNDVPSSTVEAWEKRKRELGL